MTTTTPGPAGPPKRRRRLPLRKRAMLAWASVVAVALLITAAVTAAVFVDREWASLGGNGIGTGTFNLQLSANGQNWNEYGTKPGALGITIPGADNLVPGAAPVAATIHVRNNGTYTSSLQVDVTAADSSPATTAFLAALDLTVKAGSGSAAPLVPGTPASLPNLPAGGTVQVTITIALKSTASNALLGQSVTLHAEFTGQSVAS